MLTISKNDFIVSLLVFEQIYEHYSLARWFIKEATPLSFVFCLSSLSSHDFLSSSSAHGIPLVRILVIVSVVLDKIRWFLHVRIFYFIVSSMLGNIHRLWGIRVWTLPTLFRAHGWWLIMDLKDSPFPHTKDNHPDQVPRFWRSVSQICKAGKQFNCCYNMRRHRKEKQVQIHSFPKLR